MKKSLIFIALIFSLIGCDHNGKINKESMSPLASSLTKLASTVESTVRYKNPPENISDSDLLNLATKHDPGILEPFKTYTVKVSKKNRHAIVLVCTKNGKRGLLEDAGCTGKMDKNLWQSSASCKFTLKVEEVCKKP